MAKKPPAGPPPEPDMTPFSDIVFQLLAFFVMSFKLASSEGDFNVKMPLQAPAAVTNQTPLPPLRIRLTANPDDGVLTGIKLDNRDISGFPELRQQIMNVVGQAGGPGAMAEAEIELDVDYNLHYDYAIRTITHVTGYIKDGRTIPLIEKVKFAKPREGGG